MRFLQLARLALLLAVSPITQAQPQTAPAAVTHMVESGGHKVAFHLTPGRQPTIVLDAGGGLDSTYWKSLVPVLHKRFGNAIITYDRPGFGASEEVKGPWSVQSAADDLENGLRALGATRGTVLVSHSLAGEIALYTSQRQPTWFKGVVLVDANVPNFYTDGIITAMSQAYEPAVAAARKDQQIPANRQLLALSESFEATSKAFHQAKWPTAVPVIVITAEKPPIDSPEGAQLWRQAHTEFAKGAKNRSLVIAQRSSHDVAHDRPDVVVDAIAKTLGKKAH